MIRTARIVNVLGKADRGIFGAHKVLLAFSDSKYELPAYAKSLSNLDFLVEVVSALLGRALQLPIPEPVAAISQDGSTLLFASVDVKHPDLTRCLSVSNDQIENTPTNQVILRQLANWNGIDKAIGFDEWIANADRNIGNVLFDGKDSYYLIDHNLAMRQPFVADLPVNNMLLNTKLIFANDELSRQRIKATIGAMIADISPELPETIVNGLLAEHERLDRSILASMIEFLKQRLPNLPAITRQKIATRQQSL